VNDIIEKHGSETWLTLKISLLAMEDVGKETLLTNYFKDSFVHSMKSQGVVFVVKNFELYGKMIRSSIWIFSPKERFIHLFGSYITGSHGVLLMYDITNKETLSYLSEHCQKIKNNLDYDPPLLLVGNKLDLEKNMRHLEGNMKGLEKKLKKIERNVAII